MGKSHETIKPVDIVVKSLTALLDDVGNQFQVSMHSKNLDRKYLLQRISNEGLGFATKTLPKFGKHFDSALQTGKFPPFSAFKRLPMGVLPSFLNGLTRKVFAPDGTLLENPDESAVGAVRQLAYMFYKLEGDYPKEVVNGVIGTFVETDKDLENIDPFHLGHYCYAYTASQIMSKLFSGFDPWEIIPRPGPGVTADRKHHSERYEPHVKYMKLHNVYPYSRYFYTNSRALLRNLEAYKQLPVLPDGVSKLAIVPKDSRGPRIICTEPHEFMWFQQGLGRAMMARLEQHALSRGQVNFTDQTVNGNLALSSSMSGEYVTLDMKEASDRISIALVEALFDECPDLLKALLACSTGSIKLPNGDILKKNKYASMGSALCFPVMSAVHFALAISAIQHEIGGNHTAIAKHVFVYGDDLIVHHSYAKALLTVFPLFGLKFNEQKCCLEGKFRESCGVDAFNGVNVTPQRVKTHAIRRKDPASLESFFAVFHGLFNRGYWKTARVFQKEIEDTYGQDYFPYVSKNSEAVGWIVPRDHVYARNYSRLRWSRHYQTHTIKVRVIKSNSDSIMLGSDQRLLRAFSHAQRESGTLTRRCHAKIVWKRIPLSAL